MTHDIAGQPLLSPRETLPSILHRCLDMVQEEEAEGRNAAVIDSTYFRDFAGHKGLVKGFLKKHGYSSTDMNDMLLVFITKEETQDEHLSKIG